MKKLFLIILTIISLIAVTLIGTVSAFSTEIIVDNNDIIVTTEELNYLEDKPATADDIIKYVNEKYNDSITSGQSIIIPLEVFDAFSCDLLGCVQPYSVSTCPPYESRTGEAKSIQNGQSMVITAAWTPNTSQVFLGIIDANVGYRVIAIASNVPYFQQAYVSTSDTVIALNIYNNSDVTISYEMVIDRGI